MTDRSLEKDSQRFSAYPSTSARLKRGRCASIHACRRLCGQVFSRRGARGLVILAAALQRSTHVSGAVDRAGRPAYKRSIMAPDGIVSCKRGFVPAAEIRERSWRTRSRRSPCIFALRECGPLSPSFSVPVLAAGNVLLLLLRSRATLRRGYLHLYVFLSPLSVFRYAELLCCGLPGSCTRGTGKIRLSTQGKAPLFMTNNF